MKLWQKLSFVTVSALLLTGMVSSGAVVYRSAAYNQEKTLENYEQQLKSTAYALSRELKDSSLEDYRDATKNAYLKFLIRKYGDSEYILIQDEQVICNETAFELVNPADERWETDEVFSMIQKEKDTYILLAGKRMSISGGTEYKLVLVKNISGLYQDIRTQAFGYLLIYLGASVFAILFAVFMAGKILKPLLELQRAAADISNGELGRRADVHAKDETGMLAEAFNGMAERIENQVTELKEESERRKQMLGSLAHELKTPMTSIIGYSYSLLHVNLKEEQKERALHHIYEECRRLGRLSGKLMSLIGMYDNESICMEQVSIEELFGQVISLEEYHLKEKEIRLVCSCNMESRKLDRDLFASLLVNLIDNAAKASKRGSIIELTASGSVISVKDKGVGIPKEEIKHVTEAFYMVDKARSRKEGGSGLGLALCSKIAELHGAELLIESQYGEGTKVSIRFL